MNSKFEIRKMNSTVKKINGLKNTYQKYTDEELKKIAAELRERKKTESAEKLLPDAFALVREASRRTINKEHYDVQLLSGITLFKGRISEAKTGEGKTITIYLPAFLASLDGKGVHVVTVNDYLANRDAEEARRVFDLLGVSVGCVLHSSSIKDRQAAYSCDITYVTNSELGFDYLKDHITIFKEEVVLRGLHYAIIDEIDSILIDEAKTPLIISGNGPESNDFLSDVNRFVRSLKEGVISEVTAAEKLMGAETKETGDFVKNEKERQIYLTEKGIDKVEKKFGVNSYGESGTLDLQRAINNSLRANYLMSRDIDYVVRDDKVEIVDSFTGRVLPGRRFSDGLHQAIEAKEGVTIQKENITVASITFQSFFNKYKKKAGLTGTAVTSSKEFKDVYNLEVVEIPTNKPVIRRDLDDCVFRTKHEKWNAVVRETMRAHDAGQPVLIGTASIEDSEIVSSLLKRVNIEHNVLNAKNEAIEAEIIAEAGKFGAVTVATNMAGRGTDIILDDQSRMAGGLKVIGTERHDSRRIDNQLKGRSGRQGDPGESQFYISLEDRVMRIFADKGSLEMLMMIATEDGQPLQYKPLTKIVEKAQEAIETENRLVREHLLKYDTANNEHREQIYEQRDEILNTDNIKPILADMFYDLSDELIDKYISDSTPQSEWDWNGLFNEYFDKVAYVNIQMDPVGMKKEDLKIAFRKMDDVLIEMKEKQIADPAIAASVMKTVLLRFIDRHWATFLNSMEYVKRNIGSQSYGQKDPVVEYKKKGLDLFNVMIDNIKLDVISNFMKCQVRIEAPKEQ